MTGFFSDSDTSANPIQQALQTRRKAGLPLIDLTSTNPTENGFIFPAEILMRGAARYFESRRYEPDPFGLLEARQAISNYYAARAPGLDIGPEQIVITASTSEAYSLLFSLIAEPGDNLLAPDVSYPLFDLLAQHQRLTLKNYRLLEERAWSIDQESLLEQRDSQTRAALIISPHNPTGLVLKRSCAALTRLNLPIIFDEVFAEFGVAEEKVPPLGALHAELPIFHLNGISKMFALPDMKLGWIAMNQRAAAQYAERLALLNDTFLSANGLIQSSLPALFEQGLSFTTAMTSTLRARVLQAARMINSSSSLRVNLPDAGYALFVELKVPTDEEQLVLELIDHGVLVHPGYFYGASSTPHIMISCLPREAELFAGIEKLIAYFHGRCR